MHWPASFFQTLRALVVVRIGAIGLLHALTAIFRDWVILVPLFLGLSVGLLLVGARLVFVFQIIRERLLTRLAHMLSLVGTRFLFKLKMIHWGWIGGLAIAENILQREIVVCLISPEQILTRPLVEIKQLKIINHVRFIRMLSRENVKIWHFVLFPFINRFFVIDALFSTENIIRAEFQFTFSGLKADYFPAAGVAHRPHRISLI